MLNKTDSVIVILVAELQRVPNVMSIRLRPRLPERDDVAR